MTGSCAWSVAQGEHDAVKACSKAVPHLDKQRPQGCILKIFAVDHREVRWDSTIMGSKEKQKCFSWYFEKAKTANSVCARAEKKRRTRRVAVDKRDRFHLTWVRQFNVCMTGRGEQKETVYRAPFCWGRY